MTDRSTLLITRKDLMYALAIDRSTLSRAGKKGRIPRGTWNQPTNGDPKEVGFCYTRIEALAIAEHYGRGTIPEHLFKVHPEGLRSSAPASIKAAATTDRDRYAHLIRAHRLMAEALRLFDEHGVPFPDPYGSRAIAADWAARVLPEAPPVESTELGDPWAQFNQLVASQKEVFEHPAAFRSSGDLDGLDGLDAPLLEPVEVQGPDLFAHLDEDDAFLAERNWPKGFKRLAKIDYNSLTPEAP